MGKLMSLIIGETNRIKLRESFKSSDGSMTTGGEGGRN